MILRSSYSPDKKIILESFDGDTFEVEETVALESQTIRDFLEENPNDRTVPFSGMTCKIMPKAIEYLRRHVDVEAKSEDLKKFDADFVKVDDATLNLLTMRFNDGKFLFKGISHYEGEEANNKTALPCPGELLVEEHHSYYGEPWAGGRDVFEFLAESIHLTPSSQVLEIGCGTLRVGSHFIRYLNPEHYHRLERVELSLMAAYRWIVNMVTPTKIVAPSSEEQIDYGGAASSDSHLSSGLSDLDPQLSFKACITDDAQVNHVHEAPEAGSQDTVSRKRRSDVWKFFTIETVDGYSLRRAVCKMCNVHFTINGGTSHLRRHLKQQVHAGVSKKNQQITEIAQTENM